MPETEEYQFGGFGQPTYTMVPDAVFDELLSRVTGNELKVLLYIIRRTLGFRKDADSISLAQFSEGIIKRDGTRLDSGAGVSKRGAVDAVKGLIGKGIIEAETQTDEQGGDAPTVYRLRFEGSAKSAQGVGKNRTPRYAEISTPGVQELHTQQTVLQETDNNSESATTISSIHPADLIRELVLLDKEIGGNASWPHAKQAALNLAATHAWSLAELMTALRSVRGSTVAARVKALGG